MDRLLKDALSDLDNTTPITEAKLEANPALKQLVDDYQHYAALSTALQDYQPGWSGAEFKARLARLKSEQQIVLLYRYLDTQDSLLDERRDSSSERKFKRTIVKIFVWTLVVCVMITVTAAAVIALRSGVLPSNEAINAFLELATEMAKLLFTKEGLNY